MSHPILLRGSLFLALRIGQNPGNDHSVQTSSAAARSAFRSSRAGRRHDGTIRLRTMRSRSLYEPENRSRIGCRARQPHPIVSTRDRTTKRPMDAACRISGRPRNAGGRCAPRSPRRGLRGYRTRGPARSLHDFPYQSGAIDVSRATCSSGIRRGPGKSRSEALFLERIALERSRISKRVLGASTL